MMSPFPSKTPVCSSDFMQRVLQYFSLEECQKWLEEMKKIDEILHSEISTNLSAIAWNDHHVTPVLVERFKQILVDKSIKTDWDIENFEAFHGYSVYAYPDNKEKRKLSNDPDLYYGLAKATSYGATHEHYLSDAFNLVLDGKGIFCGREEDREKFNNFYHKKEMTKGFEAELPIGMAHGHLATEDSPMWFLFVQECGFKKNLKCAGDFHVLKDYNLREF